MLDTTAKAVQHLFNSPACVLLPTGSALYTSAVLAVWQLQSGFIVKLKADGYLYYSPDAGTNAYSQTLHTAREVDELINYFNVPVR